MGNVSTNHTKINDQNSRRTAQCQVVTACIAGLFVTRWLDDNPLTNCARFLSAGIKLERLHTESYRHYQKQLPVSRHTLDDRQSGRFQSIQMLHC